MGPSDLSDPRHEASGFGRPSRSAVTEKPFLSFSPRKWSENREETEGRVNRYSISWSAALLLSPLPWSIGKRG